MWRITKYHCDDWGNPYGDPFNSICYTNELMESYKNPKYVLKIEEIVGSEYKTIWESRAK